MSQSTPTSSKQSPSRNMSSMASGSPTQLPFRNSNQPPFGDPSRSPTSNMQSFYGKPPSRDPRLIQFSETDKNGKPIIEPQSHAEIFKNVEKGKPATHGGVMVDPKKLDDIFDSFSMHTPPDVGQNTRIIGVLGITDVDPLNRDPHVSNQQRNEYANGGHVSGLVATVKKLGAEYLKTYPGEGDSGAQALHEGIEWIIKDKRNPPDVKYLERLLAQIQYRTEQQSIADLYLRVMRIDLPFGKACCNFDARQVEAKVGEKKYNSIKNMIARRPLLFPYPDTNVQGRPCYKGQDYLIAAFHLAKLNAKQIEQNLDDLATVLDQELEVDREFHKAIPAV